MNSSQNWLVAILWFGSLVSLWANEVKTLASVEKKQFEAGYAVYAEPRLSSELKKTVVTSEKVNLAAYLDTKDGRFWLTDWSYDRYQKGLSHFWIFVVPEKLQAHKDNFSPDLPSDLNDSSKWIRFSKPREIMAEGGHEVLSKPSLTVKPLKVVRERDWLTVGAVCIAEGEPFYISDWSLDRFDKKKITPNFVRVLALEESSPSSLDDLMEDWSEQTQDYSQLARTVELGRVLLPKLVERHGANSAQAIKVELALGLREWRMGHRNPALMHLRHSVPLAQKLKLEPEELQNLAEGLFRLGRHEESAAALRRLPEGHLPPEMPAELARFDGGGPSDSILLQWVGQMDPFAARSLLQDMGTTAPKRTAADFRKELAELEDAGEIDNELSNGLGITSNICRRAFLHYKLGMIPQAKRDLQAAMTATRWRIDPILEFPGMYEGVPGHLAQARELGIPPSFVEPALVKTDAALRRLARHILTNDSMDNGLTHLTAEFPASIRSAKWTAEALISLKGCLAESALQRDRFERWADHPTLAPLAKRMKGLQKVANEFHDNYAMRWSRGGSGDPTGGIEPGQDEEDATIQQALEQCRSEMARLTGDPLLNRNFGSATLAQVQQALPLDAALVEFATYSEGYAAILIRKSAEPEFLYLGSAREIEPLIEAYRSLADPDADPPKGLLDPEAKFLELSNSLYKRLVEPIEQSCPADVSSIILSPDGMLHFLSLPSLTAADGKFWCEKRRLAVVNTGRDLLIPSKITSKKSAALFGDPKFRKEGQASSVASRTLVSDARSGGLVTAAAFATGLSPLPGSREEVITLTELFKQQGWEVQSYLGEDATEQRLVQISAPRILHLATHGHTLTGLICESKRAKGSQGWIITDPMRLSFIDMAGACDTFAGMADGNKDQSSSDGILTAGEISRLNLEGVEIAVLSACDTGLGLPYSNHGVSGLKTGLFLAGVENVLLSLWPVADEETVQFMQEFYRKFLSGESPAIAFHNVQRDALLSLRAKNGLRSAVTLAGPFVLTSSRSIR